MRVFLIILCLLTFNCNAQSFKEYLNTYTKPNKVIGLSLIALGGASYGARESLLWHYPRVKQRFPSISDTFWDWKISHLNKYKDRIDGGEPAFTGSTTYLAWTTDGVHLTNTLHKNFMIGGAITISLGTKQRWYYYALDFLATSLVYQAGFHSVYSLYFRK